MRLELDLSPTLVNQTAMAHIGRDAAEALMGLDVCHSYFGEVWEGVPDGADADRLRSRLYRLLEVGSASPRKLAAGPKHGIRRVFLDPLYTLFGGLTADDIVMVLDMSVVTSPHWHNPAVVALYEKAFSLIAATQPRLLAISQNTADSYHANYGYPLRSITVIPLYVPDHLLNREGEAPFLRGDKPYFLFVGSLEARKNVAGAIKSFGLSGLAGSGYEFIVAGGRGHGAEISTEAAARTPGVILTGRVTNQDLRALYVGATGFIYPSYLEGFGVPLLEALQYGLPAVSSITGACPEVGGDLVAYCDPDDHGAIAREIVKMANLSVEEREAFSIKARDRATVDFSKAAFQTAFRAAVQEV